MGFVKTKDSRRRKAAAEAGRSNRAYAYRKSLIRAREREVEQEGYWAAGPDREASACATVPTVLAPTTTQVEPSGVGNQKKKSGSSSATDERFLQECAKRLRKQPTVAEEHMRHHLLASDGWIFQHPIRFTGNGEEMGAILDFYNPKRKLAVELDGNIHQGPKQKRRDVERTRTLAKHGITVLRFRNDEACFDTRRVLADIAAAETPSKPRRVATRKKPRATREPFIPVVKISPVVTKRHEPVIEDGLCCHELLPGTCSFCR